MIGSAWGDLTYCFRVLIPQDKYGAAERAEESIFRMASNEASGLMSSQERRQLSGGNAQYPSTPSDEWTMQTSFGFSQGFNHDFTLGTGSTPRDHAWPTSPEHITSSPVRMPRSSADAPTSTTSSTTSSPLETPQYVDGNVFMQNLGMPARAKSSTSEMLSVFGWQKPADIVSIYEPIGNVTGIHPSARSRQNTLSTSRPWQVPGQSSSDITDGKTGILSSNARKQPVNPAASPNYAGYDEFELTRTPQGPVYQSLSQPPRPGTRTAGAFTFIRTDSGSDVAILGGQSIDSAKGTRFQEPASQAHLGSNRPPMQFVWC